MALVITAALISVTVIGALVGGPHFPRPVTAGDAVPFEAPQIGNHLDKCDDWQSAYDSLSDKDKRALDKEKVVFVPGDGSGGSYYLISEQIVKDCKLRKELGRFLARVLFETDTRSDHEFAARHSTEIVGVVRQVWDSPGFTSDGLQQSKYNLLNYSGISRKDNALILTDLIKRKVVNIGLLNTIYDRPLPALKPAIIEALNQARSEGDLGQQACYLIMLERISPSPVYLKGLAKIRDTQTLDKDTRSGLEKIIKKFKTGKRPNHNDFEALPILDAEEAKTAPAGR